MTLRPGALGGSTIQSLERKEIDQGIGKSHVDRKNSRSVKGTVEPLSPGGE